MSVPSEPTANRESLKPLILLGSLSAVRVKHLKQGIGFSEPRRIQLSTNKPQLMLGETQMYGSRNIPLMPVLIAFLAGWLFAQVFTIQPKNFQGIKLTQTYKGN